MGNEIRPIRYIGIEAINQIECWFRQTILRRSQYKKHHLGETQYGRVAHRVCWMAHGIHVHLITIVSAGKCAEIRVVECITWTTTPARPHCSGPRRTCCRRIGSGSPDAIKLCSNASNDSYLLVFFIFNCDQSDLECESNGV